MKVHTGDILPQGKETSQVKRPAETMSALGRSLPDLDVAVLGALLLFQKTVLPAFPLGEFQKPLVLGSGNAGTIGRILFADSDAYYADESTYEREFARHKNDIDSAVLISASGGKDGVRIARALREWGITTWLFTDTADAPASEYIDPSRILLFPKNREPYTYNVSTYMGMLLAKTYEDVAEIRRFITEVIVQKIPDTLDQFDAFYFIIPPECILLKELFLTKFDELFGANVSVRVFTLAQSKHAKTVVPSDTECFISFGTENIVFGNEKNRIHIPLPDNVGYVALMAIGYYVIGQIQKQHPPYFKDNIEEYTQQASALFHEVITPIVE